MGVNSLTKTVTRQRRGCDLNPGPSAHEAGTLTARHSATELAECQHNDRGCSSLFVFSG